MPIFPRYDGPPLLEQVCSVENLTLAWRRVRSNIQVARRGRSAGYFDQVDHRVLLGLVRQRLDEAPLLQLLAQWLAVGALTTDETAPIAAQGASPLSRAGAALRRAAAWGAAQ